LLPAQTDFCNTSGVTVLRHDTPSDAASGKKRPTTTSAKVARLIVSDLTPQALQHHRFRLSARAPFSAVRALDLLSFARLPTATHHLAFAQLPGNLVADLASQFFQIDQRPRRR